MHKKAYIAIWALSSFILGFYIGIANHTPFNFSREIAIVVNPSIILTIILAYYVTRILTKQNEKDKQEKTNLVEYFEYFLSQLRSRCSEIIDSKNFDSTAFNVHFKYLREKLHSSVKLAKQSNFINDDDSISDNLNEEITNIWEILTDEANYNVNNSIKPEHTSLANHHIIKIEELVYEIIRKIYNS